MICKVVVITLEEHVTFFFVLFLSFLKILYIQNRFIFIEVLMVLRLAS